MLSDTDRRAYHQVFSGDSRRPSIWHTVRNIGDVRSNGHAMGIDIQPTEYEQVLLIPIPKSGHHH